MAVAHWKVGESGNPDGRGKPRRVSRARAIAELANAIARERVEFTDTVGAGRPGEEQTETETAVFTRLERLLRVVWSMALEGDLGAGRLLLEYMEGKPGRCASDTAESAGAAPSADDMVRQLRLVAAEDTRCERKESERKESGRTTRPTPGCGTSGSDAA